MLKLLIVSLIVSISCLKCFSSPSSKIALLDNSDLINEIAAKIESYQILKQVNYTPPFKWAEKQGLYSSHIRVNLFGNPMLQELRNGDLTAVFDNDMFSTGWIVTALLESILYGKGSPSLDVHRLNLALESMNDYKDRNDRNPEQTILRTFWPQIYNSTYNIWQQQPINIRNVALNIEKIPWDSIEKLLRSLKLDKLADYCVQIQKMGEESVKAFSIPPDFGKTNFDLKYV
jgi:hypothetical protein